MRIAVTILAMLAIVGCGGGGGGGGGFVGTPTIPTEPTEPTEPPAVPVDAQFPFGPSNTTSFTWESGDWVEGRLKEYEYDSKGRVREYLSYLGNDYYGYIYEYDSQDRATEERRYFQGIKDSQTDFLYNPQGLLITEDRLGVHPFTGEIWLHEVTAYEYNPDGTLHSTTTSSDENGLWVVTVANTWEYTAQGLPLAVTNTYSDPTVSDSKSLYEFDTEDRLVRSTFTEYSDDGGGQGIWQEQYHIDREYGPSGYMQTRTNYTPDDQPYRRRLYERSVDGVVVRRTGQLMKNSKWENDSLEEFYYTDSGSSHYWETTWMTKSLRWDFFRNFGGELLR